ncbi:MAG: sirohydrochlorin chelatase [Chthonomonadales bacterium]
MKRALLLLAHGSPLPDALEPVRQAAEAVAAQSTEFQMVVIGYLECNEPDIPAAIRRCVEAGCREVVVVPYFLHLGAHVAEDLPDLLSAAAARHPAVSFRLADYLGTSPRLTEILARRADEALERAAGGSPPEACR